MNTKLYKTLTIALAFAALTGCSRGIDKPLVTGQGVTAYRASLVEAMRDADPRQIEAYNWAISDLSIETIARTYPDQSPHKIIRAEVQGVLAKAPQEIAALEKQYAIWNPAAAAVRQVVAQNTSFALEKDFFGLQPRIRTKVINGSPHAYSTLRWRADLYLDGAASPVASHELFDLYKSDGGLLPGAVAAREFTVGFVSGESAWTTLEVQNARQRTVKLTVMPENATDFSERLIVGPSPEPRMTQLKRVLQDAQGYKDL